MASFDQTKSDPVMTRIDQLSAAMMPDQKRVRATLVLNDASSRPTVELTLINHMQDEIARSIIIGVFDNTVNFTLHLGYHSAETPLFLKGTVILNETEVLDTRQVSVESSGK